jgi:hypothetical protein
MAVHEIYAIVSDTIIKSVSVYKNYEAANQFARNFFGENAIAVRCDDFAVSEGDYYKNGTFYYNDGITQVKRIVSKEEEQCNKIAADVYYVAAMAEIDI